jgi:hypothetical protein
MVLMNKDEKYLTFLNFFLFFVGYICPPGSGSTDLIEFACNPGSGSFVEIWYIVGVYIQVEAQHLSLLGREWKDRQREREEAYQLRLQASCTKVLLLPA